jgi:hypothetical protein
LPGCRRRADRASSGILIPEARMKGVIVKKLMEKVGPHRLGRHVEHDPASRAFSAGTAAVKTVMHKRHTPAFDQGDLGSCTGNAMAGALMTEPLWVPGRKLTEVDAVKLYESATRLDDIPGKYKPEDTGSSGLGVMKAAVKAKYITGYAHSFSLEQLLGSLTLRPGILGINWYSSFDEPRPDGECPLTPKAKNRGGHEIQMFGIDVKKKRVWCFNSWGPTWGGTKKGTFYFSWKTLQRLLDEDGDATFPRTS